MWIRNPGNKQKNLENTETQIRNTALGITLNQGMSLSAPPTNGTWIPKVSAVEGGLISRYFFIGSSDRARILDFENNSWCKCGSASPSSVHMPLYSCPALSPEEYGSMLRSRKYFFRLRLRRALNPNCSVSSGSR
jgi:hypothetical protein